MYQVVLQGDAFTRQNSANETAVNYITKDISPEVSLSVITASDFTKVQAVKSNRIYFVLEGELELNFDDKLIKLRANDSCFIAKGTEYAMAGTFKAIVVNQPAYGS